MIRALKRLCLVLAVPASGLVLAANATRGAGVPVTPDPRYARTTPNDRISRLRRDIDRGRVKLQFKGPRGYLDSLLRALDVPVSSQTLVFSKTSVQKKLIAPKTPRAVYFNDEVYVALVPGSPSIEISTTDPRLGATF